MSDGKVDLQVNDKENSGRPDISTRTLGESQMLGILNKRGN